jgi:integrase
MTTIEEVIKSNRPNITASSIKTYSSFLRNIYKEVYPKDNHIDLDKFNKPEPFLEYLKNVDGSKRKTILASLVVITNGNEKYRELMMADGKKYNEEQKENKMSETQKSNWVTQDEIKNLFLKYQKEANALFKLTSHNMNQLQRIQDFILLCLTSGIYFPPRRSTDWCELRYKNYTKEEHNYYDKKVFGFAKYKTAKVYHEQTIDVPNELKKILNKWIKLIPDSCDYLLFDAKGNKLSNVKVTQRLNKIFGKNASVSILRHSYITEKYEKQSLGNLTLKDIQETATEMGHSLQQHLEYIKNND